MKKIKKAGMFGCLVVVLLFFSRGTQAQAMSYSPGQTVTINVAFDGRDAGEISCAQARFDLTTPSKEDQPNFQGNIPAYSCKKTGTKTFELSGVILGNVASGSYRLTQIFANFDNGEAPVQVPYSSSDFPEITITVNNPKDIEKPKIKSVTVH